MVTPPDVYEPRADESVSETVIRAVAASTDRCPADLDVRLYDAIDPDALDSLYEFDVASRPGQRVSFPLGDHRVVVDESRTVHVRAEPEQGRERDEAAADAGRVLRGAGSPWRLVFGR